MTTPLNDIYALKARVYPMVLVLLPLATTAVSISFQMDLYTRLFLSILVYGALSYLLSQTGRDEGKRKEPWLWNRWGGPPSTQLLRYRNNTLTSTTKSRYHEKLNALYPVNMEISESVERANPAGSDEAYESWVRFLIARTRDTSKYPLLFKENINYGFRRNLWALKPFAVAILGVLLIGCFFYYSHESGTFNPVLFSASYVGNLIVLLLASFFWLFIVSPKWVESIAYSYGQRLLETVESLG